MILLRRTLIFLFAALLSVPLAARPAAPAQEAATGRVQYQLPGMDEVLFREDVAYRLTESGALAADYYYAAGHRDAEPAPVVVFFNAGDAGGQRWKEEPQCFSWAQLVAATGAVAVTYDARPERALEDFEALAAFMQANAGRLGVDPGRMVIWACGRHVPPALETAMGRGSHVRGLVAYYGAPAMTDFRRSDLPMLVVLAGRDRPENIQAAADITTGGSMAGAPVTYMNHPLGGRGFDYLDGGPRTREIVAATLAFMRTHLQASAAAPLAVAPPRGAPAPPPAVAAQDLLRRADSAFGAEDWRAAGENYGAYLRSRPDDGGAHFRLGYTLIQLQQTAAAIPHFQRAAELDFVVPAANYNVACCYALLGRKDEAVAWLQRALDAGFNDLELLRTDSDLDAIRGDARFQRLAREAGALPPAPPSPPAQPRPPARPAPPAPPEPPAAPTRSAAEWAQRGTQAFQQEDWKAAVEAYSELTRLLPENGGAHFQLGYSSIKTGDYDRAIWAFKRSLGLDFERHSSAYNLACCYALKKESDMAFRWLDVAMASGFQNRELLREDSDLDHIRKDPRFQKYLQQEF